MNSKKLHALLIAALLVLVASACSHAQPASEEAGNLSPHNGNEQAASQTEPSAQSQPGTQVEHPGQSSPQTGAVKLGVTFLGNYEYINKLKENIEKEALLKKVALTTYEGKSSGELQVSNVRDMIANHVDVIILNPVDAAGSVEAVRLAADAGIPVVGINTITDTELLTTYIGSNDIQAGEMELQYIAEKLGGDGNIVILKGIEEQSSQFQRTQGILNALDKYPKIRVLDAQYGDWSTEQSYRIMKKWVEQFGDDIDGVVAQNDDMAMGAVAYLKEIGKQKDIPVIGTDAIQDALQAIKDGDLAATVFQDAAGQAKLAVDLVINISQNGHVAKSYFIPYKLVTQENIHLFLK